MKQISQYIILVFLVLFFHNTIKAQKYSDAEIKSAYIYKFAHNIEWENEKDIEKFTIAIYGNDTSMVSVLKLLSARTIKKKPVEVINYERLSEIILKKPQIIFVCQSKNFEIKDVYYQTLGSNTLLISDDCSEQIYIMLNFIYLEKGKISFEVNKGTIQEQGLKILPDLLALGGTELDLYDLYKQKEKELAKEQAKVKEQQEKLKEQHEHLEQQQELISVQNEDINKQKKELTIQKSEIENQQEQISTQHNNLAKLGLEIREQQQNIKNKEKKLENQENDIKEQEKFIIVQKTEVEAGKKVLEDQKAEIKKGQKKIDEQNEGLTNLQGTVQTQKNGILLMSLVIGTVIVLLFFIFRSYRIKKRINQELEEKNAEIMQKNNEIASQSEELKIINQELEKLSIVASETDNAVLIMDTEGNFEWINQGFTRLYGYNLQEMLQTFGKNIKDTSNNSDITKHFDDCINKQKSVIYENSIKAKNNETVWVQTTLTPIFDDFNNLIKLVAIDSDINKLKDAEFEIKNQNNKLITQKDILLKQKEEILQQNKFITSSIRYAQTIQKAILPPHEEMNKFFKSCVIYRPKDVVSGDFYWFLHLPAKNGFTEKNYVAVIDCTGHGVPGAFMSMIGSRLLNEIIFDKKITSPKNILSELSNGIRTALRQDVSDNTDGMDVSLCRFEKENKKTIMTFAGAKQNIFYYQNKKLTRLRGSRKSIGGYMLTRNTAEFAQEEIILEQNDIVYLLTDGIIDQNKKDRTRYGTRRFTKLLNSIIEKPLETQKQDIEKTLNDWQQIEKQRDDITIMAVQITK